jgi:hypothetical protein
MSGGHLIFEVTLDFGFSKKKVKIKDCLGLGFWEFVLGEYELWVGVRLTVKLGIYLGSLTNNYPNNCRDSVTF